MTDLNNEHSPKTLQGAKNRNSGIRATHSLPLILLCAGIFSLSSLSQPPAPDFGFEWGDKLNHGGAYALLMISAWWAASGFFPGKKIHILLLIAFIFSSFYGATDEFHQWFVPGRDCDVFDWMADTAGAALAGLILHSYLCRTFFFYKPGTRP